MKQSVVELIASCLARITVWSMLFGPAAVTRKSSGYNKDIVNCQFQGNLCQDPTCKPKTLRLIVLVIPRKQEILRP